MDFWHIWGLFCLFIWDKVSLCSSGCPGSRCIGQVGLQIPGLPASAFWVLELVYVSAHSTEGYFLIHSVYLFVCVQSVLTNVWKPEDNTQESGGSFCHVGLTLQTVLSSFVAPLKTFKIFIFLNYYYIYVSMLWHSVMGMDFMVYMWGSEDNFVESVLSHCGFWQLNSSSSSHVVSAFTHWAAVSPAQIGHIFCLSSVCWWAFPFPPPFWPLWTMPLWMFVYGFVVLRFEPRLHSTTNPHPQPHPPKCTRYCVTMSVQLWANES